MNRWLWNALGCLTGLILWLWPQTVHAQLTYVPLMPGERPKLCRFGVNGALGGYPVGDLRIGWYIDYAARAVRNPSPGIAYTPMIRLEARPGDNYSYSIFVKRDPTTDAQLQAVIDANPGAYWFIGNEPDRIQYQDDLKPNVYAKAYHDLYYRIKSSDPTAKIVAGGIVQPTPLRLLYLDKVVQSYYAQYKERMPVDVWAFHNFVLNEASCSYYSQFFPNDPIGLSSVCWGADIPPGIDAVDGQRIDVQLNDSIEIFKQQVVEFRKWMAKWGYRNTPAFLSEFGILMPGGLFNPDFDVARVTRFMDESFDFLMTAQDPTIGYPGDGNRLVQRFSWYSTDDSIDHNGYLFDRNNPVRAQSRTAFGDNFAAYTQAIPDNTDFTPVALKLLEPPPLNSQGTTTLNLQAVIANSGNTESFVPAQVTFYNGDPANGGQRIGEPQNIEVRGCGETATVKMAWGGVAPGTYEVFVKVSNFTSETNLANNTTSLQVQFVNDHLFLPTVSSGLGGP